MNNSHISNISQLELSNYAHIVALALFGYIFQKFPLGANEKIPKFPINNHRQ